MFHSGLHGGNSSTRLWRRDRSFIDQRLFLRGRLKPPPHVLLLGRLHTKAAPTECYATSVQGHSNYLLVQPQPWTQTSLLEGPKMEIAGDASKLQKTVTNLPLSQTMYYDNNTTARNDIPPRGWHSAKERSVPCNETCAAIKPCQRLLLVRHFQNRAQESSLQPSPPRHRNLDRAKAPYHRITAIPPTRRTAVWPQ